MYSITNASRLSGQNNTDMIPAFAHLQRVEVYIHVYYSEVKGSTAQRPYKDPAPISVSIFEKDDGSSTLSMHSMEYCRGLCGSYCTSIVWYCTASSLRCGAGDRPYLLNEQNADLTLK